MKRWPKVALGEVFHIEKGKIGIKAATAGRYPLVTTAQAFATHIEAHFSGDAVCIPLISATGHGHASLKRLHHIRGDFAVGSILCACIAKDSSAVSARFVYYYLSATMEQKLIPLMQGTANMSMRVDDIREVLIPLPSLAEQEAIVARLDALETRVRQVAEHLDAAERDADRLLDHRFQEAVSGTELVELSAVAPAVRRQVALDVHARYREVGARSFGKGLFTKPDFDGAHATWEKPVWIKAGDLVLSNIKAWEGAIAVAGADHDGAIASHRYITCVPDTQRTTVSFLQYYLLSQVGLEQVGLASPGTADRNRTLSLGNLARILVPLPVLSKQLAFDRLRAEIAELKSKHSAIRAANAALIPATLERIFADAD